MHGLPYGGVGQSGFGSYHGKYSFELFSHQKVCRFDCANTASTQASLLLILRPLVQVFLNGFFFSSGTDLYGAAEGFGVPEFRYENLTISTAYRWNICMLFPLFLETVHLRWARNRQHMPKMATQPRVQRGEQISE